MLRKKPSRISVVVSSVLTVLMIAAGLWVLVNRQYVQDVVDVWNYTPSAAIETISDDIELTHQGKLIFYATHPEVDEANSFNSNCPQQEVNNPILGCFDGERIYIFNITEEDLEGIQEVTAAHEMLHAAWLRMSAGEQERVGALLVKAYNNITDDKLHARISYYERNEPGQFINELHSILGTERISLPAELELHYDTYFQNREKIVAYHNQYNRIFEDVQERAEVLYNELTELANTINASREQYNNDLASLSSDINTFNANARTGSFSSMGAFYAERESLIARSNALDVQRDTINTTIDTYNQKYGEYNQLASRIQQLNSSIDSMSSLKTVPTINE